MTNDITHRTRRAFADLASSSSGLNMPMMRLTVAEALEVCSVLRTRWPVSPAPNTISIVSRSRISPTKMTFGAWRMAARMPTS